MSQVIEETQSEQTRPEAAADAGVNPVAAAVAQGSVHAEPHVDHGHCPARTWACLISGLGFLIGGIAFPFHVWTVVVIGGVLQIVAIVVNQVLNSAGLGPKSNRDWAAAKAAAKAARAA